MRPADLRSAMGVGSSYIPAIVPELKDKLRNLGSQPRSEPGTSRFHLFNAVRTFLARASRKRPILLALDDLHWADHASLLLLELLAQELANMSVLVVGTYRDGELSYRLVQTLGELARAQPATVELRGLSQDDVELLLTAVTGERPPGTLVRSVHDHTGGNPFFVTEVARLLGKSKAGFPIPDNVKSALSRRLSNLSDLANRLLIAASVIGGRSSSRYWSERWWTGIGERFYGRSERQCGR
jgi:predicted ATPase